MSSPQAPRRSLFAVWHWPRWTWAVILPALVVSYLLSRMPVAFALFSAGVFRDPAVNRVYKVVYAPQYVLEDHCEPFGAVVVWEWNLLVDKFGDPR